MTKYALTRGVRECTVYEIAESGKAAYVVWRAGDPFAERMRAPDWHLTREAAVSRANAMRDAKLQALQQQAERVKGLRFE